MSQISEAKKQIDHRIYQITSMAARDANLSEVLDRLAQAAVEITATDACSIRLLDEDTGELNMRSSFGLSDEYREKGPVSKNDEVIKAAFAGQTVVLDDMRNDQRVKYRTQAQKEGLVSQLTVVMEFKQKPIGVLRLYRKKLQHFDEEDIALAKLVASQCAIAITNAKLYAEAIEGARIAEQMRLAGVIQRRMIPQQTPDIEGLEVAGIYRPCFEIGGDLYDFIRLNDHAILLTIADVIGKGIPAAIGMSLFRGTIRAYADGGYDRHTLLDVVNRLNRMACNECRDGEFVTIIIGYIDTQTMTLTYCNCGHEPGLVIREKETMDLESGGMVLGVKKDADYTIETVHLEKGDALLFYTDGLIDAQNFQGQLWGRENMIKAAADSSHLPAEQMLKNILMYRRRFTGLARQIDDTSIVAVRMSKDVRAVAKGIRTSQWRK